MDRQREASRCRQRIAEGLARLTHLAEVVQGRGSMVRASLYRYRRRCGAPRCRCARGELHEGRALSVREAGRSRVVSLRSLDAAELERRIEAYRQWRQARAEMVRRFTEVLEAMDRLGKLRSVEVEHRRRVPGRAP